MSEALFAGGERPRVLLVDDERTTIEMIGAVLDHQGFDVTLCCDVGEATRLIAGEDFDALVSDVVFDGNDRGGEVLAASRSLSPDTVRILMTGYPVIEGAVSAIKHGAIDYLQKPVDPIIRPPRSGAPCTSGASIRRSSSSRTWSTSCPTWSPRPSSGWTPTPRATASARATTAARSPSASAWTCTPPNGSNWPRLPTITQDLPRRPGIPDQEGAPDRRRVQSRAAPPGPGRQAPG
ncbi:MAG: response regulator [Planctomycetota bacterium]